MLTYFDIFFFPPRSFSFLSEVTKILLFAAHASHQLVPPEVSTSPTSGDVEDGQWACMGMLAVKPSHWG